MDGAMARYPALRGVEVAVGNLDTQEEATVHNLLVKARAAFDGGKLEEGACACAEAAELDPDNADAWHLLARYGGWDSRQAELDVGFVLDAAKKAVKLTPEGGRAEEAAAEYSERKKQISEELEAIMMMPSYMGAKKLHAFMMDWLRLLKGFPELPPVVIEGEVTLVANICQRSKLAVMPNDRLVYTAYATFNKKEPYGETFERELQVRIDVERTRKEHELGAVQERVAAHLAKPGELSTEAEIERLRTDRLALQDAKASVVGLSGIKGYEDELAEVQAKLQSMGLLKLFKKHELQERMADLSGKIAELNAENEENMASMEALLARVDKRIGELSARS